MDVIILVKDNSYIALELYFNEVLKCPNLRLKDKENKVVKQIILIEDKIKIVFWDDTKILINASALIIDTNIRDVITSMNIIITENEQLNNLVPIIEQNKEEETKTFCDDINELFMVCGTMNKPEIIIHIKTKYRDYQECLKNAKKNETFFKLANRMKEYFANPSITDKAKCFLNLALLVNNTNIIDSSIEEYLNSCSLSINDLLWFVDEFKDFTKEEFLKALKTFLNPSSVRSFQTISLNQERKDKLLAYVKHAIEETENNIISVTEVDNVLARERRNPINIIRGVNFEKK